MTVDLYVAIRRDRGTWIGNDSSGWVSIPGRLLERRGPIAVSTPSGSSRTQIDGACLAILPTLSLPRLCDWWWEVAS